jgi:DNA-binding transcriptional ArsR family regulator
MIAATNLDHIMTALADPTRRAILKRLSHGEARVTEVAQPFAMSLNAVSKHIRLLERARLVRRRHTGREHFLSLNAKPLKDVSELAEEYRRFWEESFDRLDDYLHELQAKGKKQGHSTEKGYGRRP